MAGVGAHHQDGQYLKHVDLLALCYAVINVEGGDAGQVDEAEEL